MPPKHEYELAPGQAFSSDIETVLLIPINETERIPSYLEKGQEDVLRLIREHLQAQGLTVETLEAEKFQSAVTAARRRARRNSMSLSEDYVRTDMTLSGLIPGIIENLISSADLVVVPNMVLRDGEGIGGSVRWDGVRRRVPSTRGGATLSGTFQAASLRLEIFKASGANVFGGYGGLDVLWSINYRNSRMELMNDRMEDEANLREGVCVAFYPYFGADKTCRGISLSRNRQDVPVVDKST